MKLYETIQTKNASYIRNRFIKPIGIFVHSTGATNPELRRYVDAPSLLGINQYGNHWNKTDSTKSMHGFIGLDINREVAVCHTLPYNIACWGAGGGTRGSYNYDPQAHIQFEICEDNAPRSGKPPTPEQTDYYKKAWLAAEEYCAYLCKLLNLPASSIVGHYEAAKRGYASYHSDPEHWMKLFNDNMDRFRARVNMRLLSGDLPSEPEKPTEPPKEEEVLYRATVNTVNPNSLNLWTTITKSSSQGTIPKGNSVDVLQEVNATWAQVQYAGKMGYVDRQYLVKVPDATIPDPPESDARRKAIITQLKSLLDEMEGLA